MLAIASILVVVERNEDALPVFTKACLLARHFGARIELFLCDAERGYALRHAYDQSGIGPAAAALVEESRVYLDALRRAIDVPDLEIALDASCETPLYQGIVQKVLMSGPDLVVKAIGGHDGLSTGPSLNDWHLARTCPVPLLFMGRQSWSPTPRIVASVDPTNDETPGFARQIVGAARDFAVGCGGELDLVFGAVDVEADAGADAGKAAHVDPHASARVDASVDELAGAGAAARGPVFAPGVALRALASEFGVQSSHVHALRGDPERTLPEFLSRGHFDVVALGALTHRQGVARRVGSLTDALLQSSCCDFLLLKPGTYTRFAAPLPRAVAGGA